MSPRNRLSPIERLLPSVSTHGQEKTQPMYVPTGYNDARHGNSGDSGVVYNHQLEQLEPRKLLAAFVVDSVLDEADGETAIDTTLREAIVAANASTGTLDTITFDVGTFGSGATVTLTLGELDITDDVVISGIAGQTIAISGNNSSRVFDINNASVAMSYLTVTEGSATGADDDGAGINVENNGVLSLTASVVTDNHADGFGGGIHANTSTVTLIDNTVNANSSGQSGGGLRALTASVSITNSTVSDNTSGASGGGVAVSGASGELNVTDSVVSGNTATSTGGGLWVNGGPNLYVTGTTVSGNEGTYGGGIYSRGSTTTITDLTISGNTATNSGGGLWSRGSSISVIDTTISGNTSSTDIGGGIRFLDNTGTITNTTLSGNNAGTNGGGLSIRGGTVDVYSSTLYGNNATNDGGGLQLSRSTSVNLSNTLISGNTASASGQEISVSSSTLTVDGNNLFGHAGLTDAQAFSGMTPGASDIKATSDGTSVALSAILDTTLADNGGPTKTHALVAGSPALDAGDDSLVPAGVLEDQRGSERFSGTVDIGAYENNTLIVDTKRDEDDGNFGSGDFSLREAIGVANSTAGEQTIIFDKAVFSGGNDIIRLSMHDSLTITNDVSILADSGDEVIIDGDEETLVFDINSGSSVTLRSLEIRDGGQEFGASNDGGGMTVSGASYVSIIDSVIRGNYRDGNGGAISMTASSTVSISGSVIRDNTTRFSGNGGGIYIHNRSTLIVDNSEISGNHAGFSGGGIHMHGTHDRLIVTNSTISGNSADEDSGGIRGYGNVNIQNSTISGNSAGSEGGGIRVPSGSFNFINTTIVNNSARDGGGIYMANKTANAFLQNSLVSGNTATRGGHELYRFGTRFNLRGSNSLFGHSGLTNVQAFGNLSPATVGITATSDGTNPTALTDIINTTLADNGGSTKTHALIAVSPAIDGGDDSLVPGTITLDQRGENRFAGPVDIGAYEFDKPDINLVVDTLVDESDGDFSDGDLSLREAIELANFHLDTNTITFDTDTFSGTETITLDALGQLEITEDVVIDADANGGVTVARDTTSLSNFRIFDIRNSSVSISDLTITGGKTGAGGGIHAFTATLTVADTTISGNTSTNTIGGGGIYFRYGSVSVTNSTVSGNTARLRGGGIFTQSGSVSVTNSTFSGNTGGGIYSREGSVSVTNSTVSGNTADFGGGISNNLATISVTNSTISGNTASRGGGIYSREGSVSVTNSLIAGNAARSGDEIYVRDATFTSLNNLLGHSDIHSTEAFSRNFTPGVTDIVATSDSTDAIALSSILDTTLADNGGPTKTHALVAGSPAIDGGDDSLVPGTITLDQRGQDRFDGTVDIGAVEIQKPDINLVVDTLVDESDGDFSAGDLSLREAIELANFHLDTNTITFDTDTFSGTETITLDVLGQLEITEDVVIDADANGGVTVARDTTSLSNFRIFDISGSGTSVSISDLTVTGGRWSTSSTGGGGILVNTGSTLALTRSVVSGNYSSRQGGGIYVDQASLSLTDTTLDDNRSLFNGAGIYGNTATISMVNSTLSNNFTYNNVNGAGLMANAGVVNITGSSLTGNRTDDGAGVFVQNGATLTVTESTFEGNQARTDGGGIASNNSSVIVRDSTFKNNTAASGGGIHVERRTFEISGSTFEGNSASSGGGGLNFQSISTGAIVNTTFSGNQGGHGGGIKGRDGRVDLINSTLTGNAATGRGGGIYTSNDGTLHISNTLISGNTGDVSADEIREGSGARININANNLIGHAGITAADAVSGVSIGASDIDATSDGTSVALSDILNTTLADNGGLTKTHALVGSSPAIDGGDDSLVPGTITLDQRGFNRFDGTVDIGAVEIQKPDLNLVVDTLVDEDDTDYSAGDLSLREAIRLANFLSDTNTITFDTDTFSGTETITLDALGQLEITEDVVIDADSNGGVTVARDTTSLSDFRIFDIDSASVSIFDLTITGGKVTGVSLDGGGIHVNNSTLALTDVTVSGNEADNRGGGIFAKSSRVTLTNSTVSGNDAYLGGGILVGDSSLILTNSTVGGNDAYYGGGIYAKSNSSVSLALSTVSGNVADVYGGGIWAANSSVSLARSAVSGNDARFGGGGIFANDSSSVSLTNSTVSGNTVSRGNGGGIFARNGSSVSLTNSTVSGNDAGYDGAGIWAYVSSVSLAHSTVSGNVAGDNGAGIFARNGNIVSLESSTLSGNVASLRGGGIYTWDSSVSLTQSTLSGNSAYWGGGIFASFSSSSDSLANTLISGNTAALGDEIYFRGGTINADANNLFGHAGQTDAQAFVGFTPGASDIKATSDGTGVALTDILDPTLADNGGPTKTHALVASSPALNAGDNTLAIGTTDQRGVSRIIGGTVDIGAVEHIGASLVVDIMDDESDGNYLPNDLSLREAIEIANADFGLQTITFDTTTFGSGGTITLSLGSLSITDDVIISGIAGQTIAVSGNNTTRVLGVAASASLSHLTITGGNGNGGAGIANGGILALNHTTVTGNTATKGGGILNSGDLFISNSTVSGNTASLWGGGLYSTNSSAYIHVSNSTISGNHAGYDGGGLYISGATTVVTNSIISGNYTAESGGGLWSSGTVTITNSTISGNEAADSGGGLSISGSGTASITGSTVTLNQAYEGGGIANLGNLAVMNSVLTDNSAQLDGLGGGGLWNRAVGTTSFGTVTIMDTTISGNQGPKGAGFYNQGVITVTGSTISGNTSIGGSGGGFVNVGTATITNSTISSNVAGSFGGGIFQADTSATLDVIHSTISGNDVPTLFGSGISQFGGTVSITNSILANSTSGPDFDQSAGTLLSYGVNIVESGVTASPTILTVDPMLGALQDNGGPTETHALLGGSQAIDAGDNGAVPVGLLTDQRGSGFDRVLGGAVDIGAFEVQNQAPADLSIDISTIDEDASDNDVVGTVTVSDPDIGDTHTFSLTSDANGRFDIDAGTGVVTVEDASKLNHEEDDVHVINVEVEDSAGNTFDKDVTITIGDVNEAPVFDSISGTTVAENSANGTAVGTVSFTEPDDGQTHTFSLTETADGRFTIDSNGVVRVADGTKLDHEDEGNHVITVKVEDNGVGTLSFTEDVTITVSDVNEVPTDLSLDSTTVFDNVPDNTVVGTVTVSDIDDGDTHSFSLTNDAGGRFDIDASTGVVTVEDSSKLDHGQFASHDVVIQATDSGTLSFEKTVTISLLPSAPIVDTAVDENDGDYSKGDLSLREAILLANSNSDLNTITFDSTTFSGGTVTIMLNHGQLLVTEDVVIDADSVGGVNVYRDASQAKHRIFNISGSGTSASLSDLTISGGDVSDETDDVGGGVRVGSGTTLSLTDSTLAGNRGDLGGGLFNLGNLTVSRSTLSGNIADKRGGGIFNYGNAVVDNTTISDNSAPVTGPRLSSGLGGGISNRGTITIINGTISGNNAIRGGGISNYTGTTALRNTLISGNTASLGDEIHDYTGAGVVSLNNLLGHSGLSSTEAFSGFTPDSSDIVATSDSTDAIALSSILDTTLANNGGPTKTHALVASSPAIDAGSNTLSLGATDQRGLTRVFNSTVDIGAIEVQNQSPTDLSIDNSAIDEDASDDDVVGTVTVSDPDSGDTHTFSLDINDASGRFDIDAITGVVTVEDASKLNHEDDDSHVITVEVTDNVGNTFEKDLTITIGDVNEAPDDLSPTGFDVDENSINGTAVGTVTVSDVDDGDTHTFSIGSDPENRFDIDSDGVITVADGTKLDHETDDAHTITVTATDSGTLSFSKDVTITINDINEAPDGFDPNSFDVDENSANGTTVGTVTVSDVDDGDTHTFSIGGDPENRFDIDGNGVITVADGSKLDHETNDDHTITITATDSGTLSVTETVTITINDINETPTDLDIDNADVDENVLPDIRVGSVTVSDVDDGDTHTFSLSDDADGRFQINSKGVVLTKALFGLDHETNDKHAIVVDVSDSGGLSYSETITITINDVNEAPTDLDIDNTSVNENAVDDTAIGTVTVSDVDDGDTHTFSLTNDAGGRFQIDGNGVVSVKDGSLLNHEADDSHVIVVQATDSGTLSISETVTISIGDVNEVPGGLNPNDFDVNENAADGTTVGTITVSDVDDGDSHTFSIGNDPENRFDIDGNGVITVADGSKLDHETNDDHTITITATDSGTLSVTETVTITINDINETPDGLDPNSFDVDENAANGTTVGTVTVSDVDDGDTHTFSIGGDPENRFDIDGNGVITVADGTKLDHEVDDAHTITVTATDSGTLSVTETVTITINDVNESADGLSPDAFDVDENSANGTAIGTVTVSDVDDGDTHTFSIGGDPENRFDIDGNGVITVADGSKLDHETDDAHTITVTATDSGTLSFSKDVTITINDVNEAPNGLDPNALDVDENSANGTTVGTITVSDVDDGDTHTFSIGGDPEGRFDIDGNGVITVADGTKLDHEVDDAHTITVTATDSGTLSVTETVTITINDVNESPDGLSPDAFDVDENSANGTTIGTVTVSDAEGDTHTFSIGSDPENRFDIDGNGVITVADGSKLDHETDEAHTISVTATDSGTLSVTETVTITINDVNEVPDDLTIDDDSVFENVSDDTVVGTVTVSDVDNGDTHTFSLTDDAGGRFDIDPNTGVVTVEDATLLDHASSAQHTITVQATDSGALVIAKDLVIHVRSSTILVDTLIDESDGDYSKNDLSLREAIELSNAAGGTQSIEFDTATFGAGGTITLSLGQLTVADDVQINGLDAANIVVDADHISRVIEIASGASVGISDLTVTGGREAGTNDGGGILLGTHASLTLSDSTVTGNLGEFGGGVMGGNYSYLRLIASTVSGNEAHWGGGIYMDRYAAAYVSDSTISGNTANFGAGFVGSGATANISGSTISGNVAREGIGGVGVYVGSYFTISDSTISGNSAGRDGGGVYVLAASADIVNSTISGNTAGRDGGGIHAYIAGIINVINSTLADNQAGNGGGIHSYGSTLTLANTIVADSHVGGDIASTSSTINSLGFNLIEDGSLTGGNILNVDPLLGLLQNNGGMTQTHALQSGSAAINAGDNSHVPAGVTTDQRGSNRFVDTVDLGAFESGNHLPTDLSLIPDSVPENSADDTLVGTVTVSDIDAGDTHTFSLADDAGGRFDIDTNTGVVTVADGSLLDHEVNDSHVITVQATDSGALLFSKDLTITISDVNEVPAGFDPNDFDVDENSANGTTIGTVTVSDVDDGDTHTFSIGGDPDGRFDIDGSGVITVADGTKLDHETNDAHTITITVTDSGTLSVTETVTITVNDINEVPDGFDPNAFDVDENSANGTTIGTVTVSDVDDGDTHSFSIGGDPEGRFDIDGNGVITVADGSKLDHETNDDHTITITATDSGTLSVTETVTITINDINEVPDGFDPNAFDVDENSANGTTVGTVTVSDVDDGDTHTFSIGGDPEGRFGIDGNGVITVADGTKLDHEANDDHTITITATDSGTLSVTETVTITVNDINETPDGFNPNAFDVDENSANGTAVGTVTVSDVDDGDTHTFSIGGDPEGRFGIDSNGVITVADGTKLDHETNDDHTITITATDSGTLSVTETVTITVNDVNEAPTDLEITADTILDDIADGGTVGTITVSDVDAGDTHTFSLTDTAGGRFAIDSGTGEITVVDGDLIDFDVNPNHQITVLATDSGGLTRSEDFTIIVTKANRAPSDITLDNNEVNEGTADGTLIGTAAAVDAPGETHTYVLTDNAGGRFAIDSSTGEITLLDTSLIDYDTNTSHDITIRVTDTGSNTFDKTFTINVIDANGVLVPLHMRHGMRVGENLVGTMKMKITNDSGIDFVNAGDLVIKLVAKPTDGSPEVVLSQRSVNSNWASGNTKDWYFNVNYAGLPVGEYQLFGEVCYDNVATLDHVELFASKDRHGNPFVLNVGAAHFVDLVGRVEIATGTNKIVRAGAGKKVTLLVNIENHGSRHLGADNIDLSIYAEDTLGNRLATPVATRTNIHFPHLRTTGRLPVWVNAEFPAGTNPANYHFIVEVDSSNDVAESNPGGTGETNNDDNISGGTVQVLRGEIDLSGSVTDSKGTPSYSSAGPISDNRVFTLVNNGNVTTPAGATADLVMSIFDSSDTLVRTQTLQNLSMANIQPGKKRIVNALLTQNPLAADNYRVEVDIQPDNFLDSNLGNNTFEFFFDVV